MKEEAKAPAVKKPQAEATVRVDTSTLDTIMNMVGELVLVRNRLLSLGLNSNDEEMSSGSKPRRRDCRPSRCGNENAHAANQESIWPFPTRCSRLARNLNKDIVLEMRGEETDLDKNLVEALADPLIHLVRNSVDHGIEMPDDRGKPVNLKNR